MNGNNCIRCCRAAWTLLSMLGLPAAAFAQALSAQALSDAQQYLDLINQRQETAGVIAPELIEPLMALAELYYQQQEYQLAAESFERAQQVARVNYGIDSPQQLPSLARQVAAHEALGHLAQAWELEQSLLYIAGKNVDNLETLPVFRAAAAKRLDIWRRYVDGEFPPEITLGCYYDRNKLAQSFYRLAPDTSSAGDRQDCNAGERGTVLLSLLVEARSLQLSGVDSLLRNGRYASDELKELVIETLHLSNEIQRRQVTTFDPALANLMARLLAHEPENTADTVRRAEFLLHLADMNVLRARQARDMSGFDVVHEQYAQSWREMQASGVGPTRLLEIFSPVVPIVLPSFTRNPLTRVAEDAATDYIDVSFEITDQGKSRRAEIIGTSANVQRADIRSLRNLLERSSFRPRMADGQVLKAAPVSLRYFLTIQETRAD